MKIFIKSIILLCSIIIVSCSPKTDLKEATEDFIKDSIIIKFNDPKSFELVNVKFDTIKMHSMIESEIESLTDDLKIKSNELEFNKKEMEYSDIDNINSYKEIDSLTKLTIKLLNESIKDSKIKLTKPDAIDHINTHVAYRAKNRFGALILDEMLLIYFPIEKKFKLIRLQE